MKSRLARTIATLIAVFTSLFVPAITLASEHGAEPWRLDEVIPGDVLSISGTYRIRYEHFDDNFRGLQQDDDGFFQRTLVHGVLRPLEQIDLRIGAEFEDARAFATGETGLTTAMINSVELLRAYGEIHLPEVAGGTLRATGGRITMDVGSRRFVARNRYRNTINGFTGLDVAWTGDDAERSELRAFWVLPVQRLPGADGQPALRDDEIEFDDESTKVQFFGVFGARELGELCACRLEVYTFGLYEKDSDDRPTRNRKLWTHGFRALRKPAAGAFDWNVEIALQHGRSRLSTTATEGLDHLAHFEHLELGFTFDVPWSPRVALQYDYASGDDDPDDGTSERFDTLFGARRFEFGPTGIYGPFFRSNLNSPGVRVQVAPLPHVTSFVAYRAFFLASDRDGLASGFADAEGDSGHELGHQLEIRVRWQPLPGNLLLETGYAHLFDGEFLEDAPGADGNDSDYVYVQAVLTF